MRNKIALLLVLIAGIATAFVTTATAHVSNYGSAVFECNKAVTVTFTSFPNKNNNTVTNTVWKNNAVAQTQTLTFSGSNSQIFILPVVVSGNGTYRDTASWNTNGVKGSYDSGIKTLNCGTTTTTNPGTTTVPTVPTITTVTTTVSTPAPPAPPATTVTIPVVTTVVAPTTVTKVVIKIKYVTKWRTKIKTVIRYRTKPCPKATPKQLCLASPAGVWKKGTCGFAANG